MKNPSLKVVVANDEYFPLEIITIILRQCLKDARILCFQKSKTAWELLSRERPDILITDDAMPGLWGRQICERLLERKVTYPIIVFSPWPPTQQWVKECANRGLNIWFLESPFTISQFQKTLEACLGTSFDGSRK